MAEVRRPQHDLGEQPRERGRLERDGAALAVERGPGDPAAPAVQVDDDVAGTGVRLDPRDDEAGGGGGASRSKAGSARSPARRVPARGRPVIGRC